MFHWSEVKKIQKIPSIGFVLLTKVGPYLVLNVLKLSAFLLYNQFEITLH